MTDTNANADVASLAFEDALKQLEAIVARLERGDVPLEESIDIYTRGEALKATCTSLLLTPSRMLPKLLFTNAKNPYPHGLWISLWKSFPAGMRIPHVNGSPAGLAIF